MVATFNAGADDLVERGGTVTPLRMHLKVAAIVVGAWTIERRVREDADDLGAAEKVRPKSAPSVDLLCTATQLDGAFDGWRRAGIEHFEDHAARRRADARYLLQRSIRAS